MTGDLPHPGTATEMYLAAINDRLGELLARLPEPQAAATDGTVELREPATKSSVKASRGEAKGTGPGAAPVRPARTPRKSSGKS